MPRKHYPYHIKVAHHICTYRLYYALVVGAVSALFYLYCLTHKLDTGKEVFKLFADFSVVPVMETLIERSPTRKPHTHSTKKDKRG